MSKHAGFSFSEDDQKLVRWLVSLAEDGVTHGPGCNVFPCVPCDRRARRAAKLAEVAMRLGFKVDFHPRTELTPRERLVIHGAPDPDDESEWP